MTDRIKCIEVMERNFDICQKAIDDLLPALENYIAAQDNLKELILYYESKDWIDDYNADNIGEIPTDLKRGVLSQDDVWNMLCDNKQIRDMINKLANCENL